MWRGLRARLNDRGLSPPEVTVARVDRDTPDVAHALLVTHHGTVFEIDVATANGDLLAWTDQTERWPGLPIRPDVEAAFVLLAEELDARKKWFESYVEVLDHGSVMASGSPPYACPCCHHLTLSERGAFDICEVCFWEDDGQDDHDADVVRGGPNERLSLTQARENYTMFGACSERALQHVRPPRPDEQPPA
jgi:hypothetical protein